MMHVANLFSVQIVRLFIKYTTQSTLVRQTPHSSIMFFFTTLCILLYGGTAGEFTKLAESPLTYACNWFWTWTNSSVLTKICIICRWDPSPASTVYTTIAFMWARAKTTVFFGNGAPICMKMIMGWQWRTKMETTSKILAESRRVPSWLTISLAKLCRDCIKQGERWLTVVYYTR